jgi:hypothetical protein
MNTNQKKYTAFMESVCKEFNCPEMLPALNAGFKAFCEATSTFYDPVNDCENRVETGAYGVNGYTEFNDGWGDSEIIRQSDNAKVLAPTLNAYLNRHGFTGETWGKWTQEEFDQCFDEALGGIR